MGKKNYGGMDTMLVIKRERAIESGQTTAELAVATLLRDARETERDTDNTSLAQQYRLAAATLARKYGVDAEAALKKHFSV